MMQERKTHYIYYFLLVLVLFSSLKVFGLNHVIYDDESNYAFAAANNEGIGYVREHYSGLVAQWAYEPFINLFGVSQIVYRIVPLLWSTATIILLFLFLQKRYSKKVAFIATALILPTLYHHVGSLQIDIEGSIMSFFYVLCTILYFSLLSQDTSQDTKDNITFKVLLGISLGLSILVKHNGILLFAVLGISELLRTRKIIASVKQLYIPYAIGLGIFGVFYFIIAYLTDPSLLAIALQQGSGKIGPGFNLLAISHIGIWLSPLFLGLLIWIIINFKKNISSDKIYYLTWIIINLGFYLFIVKHGDFAKYTMNLMIPIAIVAALLLEAETWNVKEKTFFGILLTISCLGSLYLNTLYYEIIPRVLSEYIHKIQAFDFSFLLTYTGPSGPLLGISAVVLLSILISSAVLLFISCISKTKKYQKLFFLGFLAISLGFNLFLITEFYFHPTTIDVDSVQHQMVDYFHQEKLNYPVFSNDAGILFQLNNEHEKAKNIDNRTVGLSDYEPSDNSWPLNVLQQYGSATAMVLRWPPLPQDAPLIEFINSNCTLIKQFEDKEYLAGEIYLCSQKFE